MRSLFHPREPEPPLAAEPVPTKFPEIRGADMAAVFAGKRMAGDFYDSVRVSSERILFGLLDVAGRRDENRNLLTAAQDTFRNRGPELFSRPDINESDALTELCLDINRRLIEVCCGVHSCPAFIACYHEILGTLCYSNAGHTPALLRDGTGITELPSTGLPLGLFSHATSEAPTIGMEKGSALVAVSRGVISCLGNTDGSEDEFGLERVKQLLLQAPTGNSQSLCAAILNSVNTFSGQMPACDDRTALALVRTA